MIRWHACTICSIMWPDISDLRNRLIHGYDTVNLDILWRIIRDDLPPLMEKLEAIITAEEEEEREE